MNNMRPLRPSRPCYPITIPRDRGNPRDCPRQGAPLTYRDSHMDAKQLMSIYKGRLVPRPERLRILRQWLLAG